MPTARLVRPLLITGVATLLVAIACGGSAAADASDPNAPQIVLEAPAQGAQFYQGQRVQAAYACLAGIDRAIISCIGDVALGELVDTSLVGTHAFSVRAEDNTGAVTTVMHSYTVVDVIPPTITITTPADHAAYEVGANVTVDYSCDDGPGGSGIQACLGSLPDGAPLPTDRVGTFSVSVTAFDMAGNSATAHNTYQVVDTTPPTITIAQPMAPSGDVLPVYTLGRAVAADYSCSDGGGSGVVACAGDVPSGSPLDTASVGTHTFTVVAKDAAGNTATTTRSYRVVYVFDGFASPLSPLPTLSSVRAGDSLPVKFSLRGNWGPGAVDRVESRPLDCATTVAGGVISTANGSLSYSAGPDRYTFQWATDRAWAGTCRQLAVTLDDGTEHLANVRFTK